MSWLLSLISPTKVRDATRTSIFPLVCISTLTLCVIYMARRGFSDYDSEFDFSMAGNSLEQRSWFFGFKGNPLVGLQSIDQATMRWLEPHSIILVLLGGPWGLVVGSTFTFLMVGVAVGYLLRSLQFSPTVSRWTALLVAANTVGGEFIGISGIDLYRLTPSKGSLISGAYLLVGIIAKVRQPTQSLVSIRNLRVGTSVVMLCIWISAVHAHYFPIVLPFSFLVGTLLLAMHLHPSGYKHLGWLVIAIPLLTAWLAAGALRFHLGMLLNSALVELPAERRDTAPVSGQNLVHLLQESLFPLHRWELLTLILSVLVIFFSIHSMSVRRSVFRRQSAITIASVGFLITYEVVDERLPNPLPVSPEYIGWVFLPIFVASALVGASIALATVKKLRSRIRNRKLLLTVRTLGRLAVILIIAQSLRGPALIYYREFILGVAQSPIENAPSWSTYIADKIAVTGRLQEFRGRFAILQAPSDDNPVLNHYQIPFPLLAQLGVPTIHDQGHFQSAMFVWFIETQFRDGLPLSNIKNNYPIQTSSPELLTAMGVRFLAAADGQLVPYGFQLVDEVSEFELGGQRLQLYENEYFRSGGDAILELSKSNHLSSFLHQWRIGEIPKGVYQLDRVNEATQYSERDLQLAPLTNSVLKMSGRETLVSARSDGRAIVVIPIEYSNCLNLRSVSGDSSPRLLRVNGILTGIAFDRALDASVTYRTSPFHNSGCRLSDRDDFRRLTDG